MGTRLAALWLTAMLLAGTAVQAQAADLRGNVRVVLGLEPETQILLRYVGQPASGGYRLTDECGGGIIRYEDADSPALAQWLLERAETMGVERFLNEDGVAEYENLPQGLYLLSQPQGNVDPFLIPMPYEGVWEFTVHPAAGFYPESPKTGQHPAPLIGAMGMVLSGLGLAVCLEKIRKK